MRPLLQTSSCSLPVDFVPPRLSALTVVVLLLLAIAGFNVANLLFAQAVNRQREMADAQREFVSHLNFQKITDFALARDGRE